MRSVARIVEGIIQSKPFIEDAISKGILNYAAYAEMIAPEVEKEFKGKVKPSAIMMAARRMAERLKDRPAFRAPALLRESDIMIRSDLFVLTFSKSKSAATCIKKVYEISDYTKGDFLTVTQGLFEVTLIASKKHKKEIEKIFKEEDREEEIKDLCSLTIRIPPKSVETVGLFYVVTKALNWENINIIEIVSTFTEMTFIIKEEDASRAFNAVKQIIDSQLN